ncbi:MAG: hypothetical protein ACU4F9_01785 [Arcticibacter sp.]
MKKLLIMVLALSSFSVCNAQSQFDFLIGSSGSGIAIGFAAKDLSKGGLGVYTHTNGFNEAFEAYETGTDFSSIADETQITDNGVVESDTWGISFGLTQRLSKKDSEKGKFTLFVGSGFATTWEASERYEYYVWYSSPSLNEGNLKYYLSSTETIPIFETLIGYDFKTKGSLKININGGYVTKHGYVAMIGLGF